MTDGSQNDFGSFTKNEQINSLLIRLVDDVRQFTEEQLNQIRRLAQIGTALSAEKNIDRLLEMIVDEARKFTNADGGTLYIMSDDETELQFAIIQSDLLKTRMGGTGGKITWPPIKLRNSNDSPNYSNVSAYVALSGEVVNIDDVYDAQGFNFEGTKRFDRETGYRSKSMLVVPLRNHENDIIGVLQLLNAKAPVNGNVINFSQESQEMTLSLASQAAVSLSNNKLIHDLENLLEAFVQTIATAIDEKSPYTGGHVRRVADLTMAIAKMINRATDGYFAAINFSDDELNELRMAAWLHDIGKITTPEHVVDKATRLETVHDRINEIRIRFELLKKEYSLEIERIDGNKDGDKPRSSEDIAMSIKQLDEEYALLEELNHGDEFTRDEIIEKIKDIAKRQLLIAKKSLPLLTDNEITNLSIRRGTLNDEERNIINNHALVTFKMLSLLPFPKKLRHVANYAAAHHEKIDGTGYPFQLSGEQLSLQSRIIAIADIFEALTAKDRPYKKGKTLAEALKIMQFMVKDRHIDSNVYNLFIEQKIYSDYARRELSLHQIDI
jgi:HD-GYP domain-containing protein (c-di-GMP phosphodiesterase class II)